MRRISKVLEGSPASRHLVRAGDVLLMINGEAVLDEIDYQALTARRYVKLTLANEDGLQREVKIVKATDAALGLQFEDSLIGNPRTCGNNCVFCFVDQMPKGLRTSLYVKDDDWRLSLLTGNFITLTNVGEQEFERILKRKASPLYISVHATDMALRARLLGNQKQGHKLMERLIRLKDAGLYYHCQLVLCPGLNDGPELTRSLEDLLALTPAALSVAAVPVGLTRHREGLPDLRAYTKQEALDVLALCHDFQKKALDKTGTRFVFPADEFYSLAGSKVPPAANYEHFAQLENGIGMLRKFEDELKAASQADDTPDQGPPVKVLLPCGTALFPYLQAWVDTYLPPRIQAEPIAIRNQFFGETVTVSGLLVGRDLIEQLRGKKADAVLICQTLLNSDQELFLDDLQPADVQRALGQPVLVFANDGEAFYQLLTRDLVPKKENA